MEDKGAACTCGWLNRHVVSAQRPEPRIRNATPAGLSSPFLRGSHRDRGCSAARLWFDDRGRSMHVRTADGANVSWRRFCVASRRQAIARGVPAREYGWGGCYKNTDQWNSWRCCARTSGRAKVGGDIVRWWREVPCSFSLRAGGPNQWRWAFLLQIAMVPGKAGPQAHVAARAISAIDFLFPLSTVYSMSLDWAVSPVGRNR